MFIGATTPQQAAEKYQVKTGLFHESFELLTGEHFLLYYL